MWRGAANEQMTVCLQCVKRSRQWSAKVCLIAYGKQPHRLDRVKLDMLLFPRIQQVYLMPDQRALEGGVEPGELLKRESKAQAG